MPADTEDSFRNKWSKNRRLVWDETLNPDTETHRWILSRNGFKDDGEFSGFLTGKRRILDAGCGNGRVTALLRRLCQSPSTEIVGIDFAVADVAAENLKEWESIKIFSRDLTKDLTDLGRFDYIYCQEVLHHTGDPFGAFARLAGILEPDGEIAIYVYKKKAPMREMTDDFIREKVGGLSYEAAIRACRGIAELGRVLAELNLRVNVPDVEVLGIHAGEYDLQRFIYFHFLKCYWNANLSPHDNAVVNYDWYHPKTASRHTPDEVRGWFSSVGLTVIHECVDHYGITMRGVRR